MKVVAIQPLLGSGVPLQLLSCTAAGGFPSPAADYYEPPISLDELLNIRAPHIWIVKVEGESMRDAGIFTGTRLIIDRTVTACSGHIVMAYVDNQPVVKGVDQAVVSPAAISITAMAAGRSRSNCSGLDEAD